MRETSKLRQKTRNNLSQCMSKMNSFLTSLKAVGPINPCSEEVHGAYVLFISLKYDIECGCFFM